MHNLIDKSDKLFKWSDYDRSNQFLPSSKAQTPPSKATQSLHLFSPRLPDRNLQTLRQTDLQMSKRSGPWPKALPFCQFPRAQTRNDLHTQPDEGQSAVLCRQPPHNESNPGRDQRNKSCTYRSARYVLDGCAVRNHYRSQ